METNYYIIEDICEILGKPKGKAASRKTVYNYINKGELPKPEPRKHLGRSVWLKSAVNNCDIVRNSILFN